MASENEDDFDLSDFFQDEETAEIFKAQIEVGGVVAAIVEGDGVLLGLSVEKIREFLSLAETNGENGLVVLVRGKAASQLADEEESNLKN